MAEPQADPDSVPKPRKSRRWRPDRAALADAGLEAVSFALMAFIALGFSTYAGRREISRALAEAWLAERGIEGLISVESLDASGFAGSIRLGPANDPYFSAKRIEVAYDLTAPWSGGPFAIDTRAVRITSPRLRARYDGQTLTFGKLQPLIDEALKSPGEKKEGGPAVLVEDARVTLDTPGGVARLTGDASLDDGQLLRLDAAVAAMRYATDALQVDLRGAVLRARKRGDRLTVDARAEVEGLDAEQVDLEGADARLEADVAYPDLKRLAATGPADVKLSIKAEGLRAGETSLADVETRLTLAGLVAGDFKKGGAAARVSGQARAGRLVAPGVEARSFAAEIDSDALRVDFDSAGVRALGPARLRGTAEQALAGGAALSRAAVDVKSSNLSFSAPKGGAIGLTGAVSVAAGVGRAARDGLGLSALVLDAKGRFRAGEGLNLTLAGRAGADGAVSAPDAERLTAGLPNPDYAVAARKALGDFELDAPDLRLEIGGGKLAAFAGKPVTLASASGAKATLTAGGGRLLESAGGVSRGSATLALAGGGLPELTLAATNWRADAAGFSSPVALSGTLDVPPAEGIKLDAKGQARAANGAFDFRLSGCTPVSVAAIEAGEAGERPIQDIALDVCPVAAPLVRVANGRWEAQARFANGRGAITAAEAKAEGVAGTFVGGGQGFDRAEVRLTEGRLVDAASAKRFEPVKATGRLALASGVWSGGVDVTTASGFALGRIDIRHGVESGRGSALIDASNIVFSKQQGLQPVAVSPMAAFASEAEGKASFKGRFDWTDQGVTSSGEVSTQGLDFRASPLGFVATLNGDVKFVSLAPLTSAPDQKLAITRIDSIVPLEAIEGVFTLGATSLQVSRAQLTAAKGKISIEPLDIPLDGKAISGVIVIDGLDLGELTAGSTLADKVKLDAVVSGRLPFQFSDKGFKLLDGKLNAIKPGHISISREALTGVEANQTASQAESDSPGNPNNATVAQQPVNAIQDFAYQAMENLAFDTLEAGVNSTPNGRLSLLFHIKGEHDPKVAEKAKVGLLELIQGKAFQRRIPLPAKTPVDLTLDTSLNFDELLAAWGRRFAEETEETRRSAPVQP
ncbi:intermembrane phospholipid transport protein YdbH family protein [Caulobacter hibisci]|uniref:YdbH domain-containing protein n=1 Tax=Caulobacter hibisci TaxID=2035993 RepID=A0ABS0SZ14_9CAUL|nr:YdbH domain-containing protein [Caulobacter hibisci]MBI1684789.1 YdbH domain-containing protein [Caulobacter hibisci]